MDTGDDTNRTITQNWLVAFAHKGRYVVRFRYTFYLPRGVAQLGSASALGAEGRWFESSRPDQGLAGVVHR